MLLGFATTTTFRKESTTVALFKNCMLHLQVRNFNQMQLSSIIGGIMHTYRVEKLPPPKRKQTVKLLDAFLESEKMHESG